MSTRSIFHPGTPVYTPKAQRLYREASEACSAIYKKMHDKGYPDIEIRDLVLSAYWSTLVFEGAIAAFDKQPEGGQEA